MCKSSTILNLRLPTWLKDKIGRFSKSVGETESEYTRVAVQQRMERESVHTKQQAIRQQ